MKKKHSEKRRSPVTCIRGERGFGNRHKRGGWGGVKRGNGVGNTVGESLVLEILVSSKKNKRVCGINGSVPRKGGSKGEATKQAGRKGRL